MKDFDTVLDDALNDRMTTRLRVVQLSGATRRFGGKEWQWFCLCVTGEGCPCKSPFLIPIRDILDRFVLDEKTEEGDEIVEIVIPRDTDVLRQRVAKSSVAGLVASGGSGCGCESGHGDIPDVMQLGIFEGIRKAFQLGVAIGTAADQLADGALSDYVADKFQEWDDFFNKD